MGNNKLEHDSIINKTKSQGFTGIISDCSNIKYFFSLEGIGRFIQGSDLVGLWRFWIYYDTGHEILWKTVDWIYNNEIRFEIYDIKARQYWIGELENWNQYKRHMGFTLCCITLSSSLTTTNNKEQVSPFFVYYEE